MFLIHRIRICSELAMDVENELTIEMEVSPVPKDMAQDMMGAVKRVF